MFCTAADGIRHEQALLIRETGYVATYDSGVGSENTVLSAIRAGTCGAYVVVTVFVRRVLVPRTDKSVAISVGA
jgi:hypothetical protein